MLYALCAMLYARKLEDGRNLPEGLPPVQVFQK
jgi:hypothetical protein